MVRTVYNVYKQSISIFWFYDIIQHGYIIPASALPTRIPHSHRNNNRNGTDNGDDNNDYGGYWIAIIFNGPAEVQFTQCCIGHIFES